MQNMSDYFIDENELVHHRKREHPSKIVCKYFLTNPCKRSSNQGALCWFRHDQLPLCAPNVANAAHGVEISVSLLWNKKNAFFLSWPRDLWQECNNKCWLDATAETPTAATATTAPGDNDNDNDPENEHEYIKTETDDHIDLKKKGHSDDIDKQCLKQRLNAIKSIPNTWFEKQQQTIWKHSTSIVFNYSKKSPDSRYD